MKPVENTNLNDLIESAAQSLILERRKDAESRIKTIFIRQEAMSDSIRSKQNELKKLEDKMAKSTAKIERLRKGDWAVLAEIEKEEANEKNDPRDQRNNQAATA